MNVPEAVQASETCDAPQCPAYALVAVLMPATSKRLVFCGHHFDGYSKLHSPYVVVRDSRKACVPA